MPHLFTIQLIRDRTEMSPVAFSKSIGFTYPQVWAWTAGVNMPSKGSRMVLARALGLGEEELIFKKSPDAQPR
jgi:DNA-binding transcriptional regulator YiaG